MSDPNNSAQPITNSASSMPPDALSQTSSTPQENGKVANSVPASANKQKIIKIKEGEILRYKSKSQRPVMKKSLSIDHFNDKLSFMIK